MKNPDSHLALKILAGLGALALFLFLVVPAFLGFMVLHKLQVASEEELLRNAGRASSTGMIGGLGEEGSDCGGPERLPCRPGLSCTVAPGSEATGICKKGTMTAPSAAVPGKLGEACDGNRGCEAVLYCKHSPASAKGVCLARETGSPYVVSLKLDNLQSRNGEYAGKVGTVVDVTVTAANAESATLRFVDGDGAQRELATLTKHPGGEYTANFKVAPGMAGQVRVTLTSKNGDTADFYGHIATIE